MRLRIRDTIELVAALATGSPIASAERRGYRAAIREPHDGASESGRK